MEPTVMLAQLTDRTENPTILCRVVKTWDIIYPNNARCRTMRYLLVDSEENAIEAEISKADQSLLPIKPEDGNVYLFRQFRVEPPTGGYNATGHTYIVRMTKWTEARRFDNLTVEPPLFYFNFREFEEVGTAIRGPRAVVDIIGRITSIGPQQNIIALNNPAVIRDILVENTRGKTLRVTLWTNFVPLIDEVAISEASKQSPIVYAFSSLELRTYNGEPYLKTYSATKIYTEQDQPHIAQYLQQFTRESHPVNVLQPRVFQSSKPSKMTTPINISLQDLINLEPYSNKDQQFACLADIDGIVNQDSWSYSACPECKVSVFCDGNPVICHNCQTTITSAIQWYRLLLRVTDGDTVAEFTVMGKQAESIINKKADMLFAESRRTGKMVPQSLENICGRRFLFTVDINITQLHRQRLSYNVNKIEPVPAILPPVLQTQLLPTNIRENHLPTESHSPISAMKRKADHTGLSPQAAQLLIDSSQERPTSSHSSRTRRKILSASTEGRATSRIGRLCT